LRIATTLVDDAAELLEIDDPLIVEAWASHTLGIFYKPQMSFDAQAELERTLWPTILMVAESRQNPAGLALLNALAVVADPALAAKMGAAADRVRATGVPGPPWAAEIGHVEFEGARQLKDVLDDHEAYYATFRYPGRQPHAVTALYDKARERSSETHSWTTSPRASSTDRSRTACGGWTRNLH
jgi:hypothetical protein